MSPSDLSCFHWRSGGYKNREEWLDNLFARDPEKLWPVQRVFMPIWREAGKLQAVKSAYHEMTHIRILAIEIDTQARRGLSCIDTHLLLHKET